MSIRLYTGEPGAGKSLAVCAEIVDRIVKTDSVIVTNMAFKLDPWMLGDKPQMGLRAYLEHEHGETFNVDQRIRFLEEEECYEFYRHRGGGHSVDCLRDAKGNPTELDWKAIVEGDLTHVVYVIDEFWKYAGAREWATTGKALIDYGKQHRKVGDEVYLMSHHFKDIDSAIQRIIETTVCMKNHSRMRIGLFRQPSMFTAAHYQRVPSGAAAPMNVSHFQLDAKGLAQCYDTSAGVGGVSGGMSADTKVKRKGIPFWGMIVLVLLVCAAVTRIPWMFGYIVKKSSMSAMKAAHSVSPVKTADLVTNATPALNEPRTPADEKEMIAPLRSREDSIAKKAVKGEKPVDESETVYLVGLTRVQDKVYVCLSDGNRYCQGDPELRLVTAEFVVIDKTVYRWPKQPSYAKAKENEARNAYMPQGLQNVNHVVIAGSGEMRNRPVNIKWQK